MSAEMNSSISYSYLTKAQDASAYGIAIISSLLSIYGSCTIMYLVSRRPHIWTDKLQLYHRIIFCLSITDIVTTVTLTYAPMMNRSDTGTLFALGSIATCECSGFFFQFFLGTVFFNCILSIYFVRIVRYGHAVETVFVWEYLVLGMGFIFPLGVGMAGLAWDALNPSLLLGVCVFTNYPHYCVSSGEPCQRGPQHSYRYWFHDGTAIFLSFTGIVCTWLVYLTIRRQRGHSYSQHGVQLQKKRTRAVAVQAIWYTMAFLPPLMTIILDAIVYAVYVTPELEQASDLQNSWVVIAAHFVSYLLFPLQGFLNGIVYVRPRLVRWKDAHPDKTWMWAYKRVLSGDAAPTTSRTAHLAEGNRGSTPIAVAASSAPVIMEAAQEELKPRASCATVP